MNIKKLLIIPILMMHTMTQSFDFEKIDINQVAVGGLLTVSVSAICYMWATSGDSVTQRIDDAKEDLATMQEYEAVFNTAPILGEKETQINKILQQLNIDLKHINKTYDNKLHQDLTTLTKTYNNLWFKSFYGGNEIAAITREVYTNKEKIQTLIKYLQTHQIFIHGNQIINEAPTLLSRNALQNNDEIMKAVKSYDPTAPYPLVVYIRKIKKDLECIEFLITQKTAQQDYPQLSAIIIQYQMQLEEIKSSICSMETYKQEAFNKLESDIAQLTEKCQQLELLITRLQHEVQMLKMRN